MKVALVYSFSDSDWFSCTVITKNILKAYMELYSDAELVHINYSEKSDDLSKYEEELLACDLISFIDHKPTPLKFFSYFRESKQILSKKFVFHIFGDFTLWLSDWKNVFDTLKDGDVKIICASLAQKDLVQRLINNEDNLFVLPFPVDIKKIRNKKTTESNKRVFAFAGRLSYQKRIVEMIECFVEAKKDGLIDDEDELHLIGGFDNIGHPFIGNHHIEGEYFRLVNRAVKAVGEQSKFIKFVGQLSHDELLDYFCRVDYFYSLSTYHDEDYGMAVAEALCSGVPCLLTRWGGYGSFNIDEHSACSYVPVKLNYPMAIIKQEDVKKSFKKLLSIQLSRSEISKEYCKKLGVTGVSNKLSEILNITSPALEEISSSIRKVSSYFENARYNPFVCEVSRNFNKEYYNIYEPYIK